MSLGLLLHQPWPIWDLRSAVFPLGVVFPARIHRAPGGSARCGHPCLHRAPRGGGAVDCQHLAGVVGRAQPLAERSRSGRPGRRALCDGQAECRVRPLRIAAARRHGLRARCVRSAPAAGRCVLAMGSGRPRVRRVSSIQRGDVCRCRTDAARSRASVSPQAAGLILITAGIAAMLLGVADAAYWGEAFHSVRAAFDFTVVQRLSSRGFERPWCNLARSASGARCRSPSLPASACAINGAAPSGLSCRCVSSAPCPAKRARYMIPVVPFVCLLAVEGPAAVDPVQRHREARLASAAALICGLSLGLIHDVAHYRLPRSNAEVQLAGCAIRERRKARGIGSGAGVADGRPSISAAGSHCRFLRSRDDATGWISRFQLTSGTWVLVDRRSLSTSEVREALTGAGYHEARNDADSGYVLWRP